MRKTNRIRHARTSKSRAGIAHCNKCKDGRLIELKPRGLLFCGFCGYETSSRSELKLR